MTGAPDLIGFVGHCRRLGLVVPVSATIDLATALEVLTGDGVLTPAALAAAAPPVLAASHDELALVALAVDTFLTGSPPPAVPLGVPVVVAVDDGGDPPADEDGPVPAETVVVRWSAVEHLRHLDLATCTPEERAELDRCIDRLRAGRARRRSHRRRPTRRRHGDLALRPTVADALRHGGEPLRLHRRRPTPRPRPVLLLVDVSGSMAPYSRALLRFAHALGRSGPGVEVFALGTRLTRLTTALSPRDPDAALAAAAEAVEDWSGGTRLGDTLGVLLDDWAPRGIGRGATVVVLSDGWDRGDPGELATHMARLHRLAHRVVWVNPLIVTPGYAPLARGMAAALPHVDDFVAGHSLAALEELAALVADDRRPTTREVAR